MKKVLLFATAAAIFSCGSDNQDIEECTNKLWSLAENCPEEVGAECSYIATYGETAETAGSVNTNQSTYEFYIAKGNTNNGTICWEGTK